MDMVFILPNVSLANEDDSSRTMNMSAQTNIMVHFFPLYTHIWSFLTAQIHMHFFQEKLFSQNCKKNIHGLCLNCPLWGLVSCIIRLNLALSLAFPTGMGNPEPFKLMRPPVDGVASLLSLILLSPTPSWDSEPRVARERRAGILSLARDVEPRTSIERLKNKRKEQKVTKVAETVSS